MKDRNDRVRIGVSSCLLGAKVRFDGGHKKDDFLVNTFGEWVQWVPVCPEVEVGMGTPRESVRLVRKDADVRMVAPKSGKDWSEAMRTYSAQRVEKLATSELSGYVLKKDSPSCGMERVKVYGDGMPTKSGRGVFAEALLARLPNLPVEEEGRLCDPRLRDNFVERVFAYHRLRQFFSGRWTVGGLVAFADAMRRRRALPGAVGTIPARQSAWRERVHPQLPPGRCLGQRSKSRPQAEILRHTVRSIRGCASTRRTDRFAPF